MRQAKEYRSSLILAAAVAGAGLIAGCVTNHPATPATVPSHQWDAHEAAAYQRYLMDENLPHEDYSSLTAAQQQDYWDWRARHPGN